MGVDDDMSVAPPSFQGLKHMVAAVRGDAGHLFAAIQQENPFAAEARSRLLESLESIHGKLLTEADENGSLAIPNRPDTGRAERATEFRRIGGAPRAVGPPASRLQCIRRVFAALPERVRFSPPLQGEGWVGMVFTVDHSTLNLYKLQQSHPTRVAMTTQAETPSGLSKTDKEKIEYVRSEVLRAGEQLRARHSWLRHQDAIGALILAFSIAACLAAHGPTRTAYCRLGHALHWSLSSPRSRTNSNTT